MFILIWFAFLICKVESQSGGWGTHIDLPDLGVPNYRCAPSLMAPSKVKPANVNSVRPADISYIMALGDSLTAGNGAKSKGFIGLFQQDRGTSFTMGGEQTLESHITIPNILRKYNPNLFGYSVGSGLRSNFSVTHFNMAWPGAHSYDLPDQAYDLIKTLREHLDQRSINEEWKLLNIFIGVNDLCQYCTNATRHTAKYFASNIKRAVNIVKENVPRVIVNLIGIMYLDLVRQVDKTKICEDLHLFACKCEFHPLTNQQMREVSISYQRAEKQLLEQSGIFEANDFTLVIQPFYNDVTTVPRIEFNGAVDLRFLAPDCFHFSVLGHADAASWAWKNMMEPVGRKTTKARLGVPPLPLACPDPTCPFIRTVKNSQDCKRYYTPPAW